MLLCRSALVVDTRDVGAEVKHGEANVTGEESIRHRQTQEHEELAEAKQEDRGHQKAAELSWLALNTRPDY